MTLVTPSTLHDDAYRIPHALVQLTYYDTINETQVGPIPLTAHISRPNDNEVSWRDPSVTCQLLRVRTVEAIMRAKKEESKEQFVNCFVERSCMNSYIARSTVSQADDGNVDLAKQELEEWIEEFHKEAFEVGASNTVLVKQLLVDLTDCLTALAKHEYNPYAVNDLGVKMNTHWLQRCSEPIIHGKQK